MVGSGSRKILKQKYPGLVLSIGNLPFSLKRVTTLIVIFVSGRSLSLMMLRMDPDMFIGSAFGYVTNAMQSSSKHHHNQRKQLAPSGPDRALRGRCCGRYSA
jgi:hypothetical protein